MNDALAKSNIDVINIQETWYNDSISSTEITSGTNYTIIRADRSSFINTRRTGVGVATFIKCSVDFEPIIINLKTTIEFIAVRIKLESRTLIIVNIYIPPYRSSTLALVVELSSLIENIKCKYGSDDLLVVGDFNLSRIKWKFSSDNVGY